MTEDLSFRRHLRALRRQAWLIVLCVAGALVAAAIVVAVQPSVHRASMKVLVGQGGGPFRPDNGGAVDPFTQTMADLLQSDVVASAVIRELGLDTTPRDLLADMTVSTKPQTAVLAVTYDSDSGAEAVRILRATGAAFAAIVAVRFDGPRSGAVTATIFDPAHLEAGRVSPQPAKTLGLAAVFGLLVGVGLALAREAFKPRLESRAQAEEWLGAPVVATLPPRSAQTSPVAAWFGRDRNEALVRALAPLAARLRARDDGHRLIVVTSADEEPAKSLFAAHLGAALAAAGEHAVCVAVDDHDGGVRAYLAGRVDLPTPRSARAALGPERRAPALEVVRVAGGRSRRGGPPTAKDVVSVGRRLSSEGRCVVVDAPSLLGSPHTAALARASDTTLLVTREGATTRADVETARALLEPSSDSSVGVVLADRHAVRRGRPSPRAASRWLASTATALAARLPREPAHAARRARRRRAGRRRRPPPGRAA